MLTPRQSLWTIVGLLGGVLATVLIVSIVVSATKATQIRTTQTSNQQLLQTTTRILRKVEDCTTPKTGECYERGQKQTATAIGNINRVSVLAAACADRHGVQGASEIYACVMRRLTAHAHR